MAETSIQWADHSVNPIRARHSPSNKVGHYCEKVSPGCAHCYSSALQRRFGTPAFGSGQHRGEMNVFLDSSKLQEVLRRRKPTKYFWCDMTDLFGDWVPDEWVDRCFAVMALTPQHTHQVLTKRTERMADYLASRGKSMEFWETQARSLGWTLQFKHPETSEMFGLCKFPLPNVWCGTSVEDRQRKGRIGVLRQVPAAVRFLSLEPLLEDLGEVGLDGIHWCIVGGESGPHARPCDVAWVRSLVAQCRAANVPCFVKQLGSRPVESEPEDGPEWPVVLEYGSAGYCEPRLRDRKGGDPDEWPGDLRVREFPRGGDA